MPDPEDVCVLVPTLNEAETIGEVVDEFGERGYTNVLVVDGRSDDGTAEVAAEHGARVVEQTGTGKGQAIREGLRRIETEYVLMLDGDGTYRPDDAERMLAPLDDGYEHVVGNRFAEMEDGAMTRLNTFGNRAINRAFRVIHGRNFKDILSGYRAFTRESAERFRLDADGFGVETEMAVECVRHDLPTTVVPVQYEERPEDSETNLHPLRDGGNIVLTLYQLAKTNNPLVYFGVMGLSSGLFGVLLGVYVGVEWVTRSVSHEVLAIVAGVSILFGVQLLIFGVLSDLIVTLHREQMHRIEERR
ncbi:S-layer glycoprotein N-glycosyltransferase AglJ [Halomicrococcus sp. SG-WS-1]|uniref:S-layer glycoprotein N-glycosyltransferase AglJ n=1 Tax=Halomicrococcus sp. SG-WS-1 TaxID=3439057 RepID=UPI003F7A7788